MVMCKDGCKWWWLVDWNEKIINNFISHKIFSVIFKCLFILTLDKWQYSNDNTDMYIQGHMHFTIQECIKFTKVIGKQNTMHWKMCQESVKWTQSPMNWVKYLTLVILRKIGLVCVYQAAHFIRVFRQTCNSCHACTIKFVYCLVETPVTYIPVQVSSQAC